MLDNFWVTKMKEKEKEQFQIIESVQIFNYPKLIQNFYEIMKCYNGVSTELWLFLMGSFILNVEMLQKY